MSNEYAKLEVKPDMREWCKRPGAVNKKGEIQYFTEQAHKDQCDINKILKKYDRDGLITHVQKIEAKFGDMTGADFQDMQNKVLNAVNMFKDLPSEIRNKFDNSPAELLRYMENPANREEAIKLGMIKESWTEASDGLGEHVQHGKNISKETGLPDPVEEK